MVMIRPDPGVACPLQDGVEICGEVLVIEMGVRVDQCHENRLEMILRLRLRIAMLNTKETRPCASVSRRMRCELTCDVRCLAGHADGEGIVGKIEVVGPIFVGEIQTANGLLHRRPDRSKRVRSAT